jgi:hypothetical protein
VFLCLALAKFFLLKFNFIKISFMKKTLKILAIILAGLAVIFAALWFLFYATFQSNLWTKYPEPLRTQMAITHLEITDMENLICHEDCMYAKQGYREIIAEYLVKNGENSEVAGQIKEKILDENEDKNTRQDLVRVLKMAEDIKVTKDSGYKIKAPQYLIDYLSELSGDQHLKDLMVSEFSSDPALAQGTVNSLLAKIKNTGLGIDVRIPAIENLASLASKDVPGTEKSTTTGPIPLLKDVLDYPAICNAFMSAAEEKGDIKLRYAAVNSLPCVKYKELYSVEIFNRLQNLLFNENNQSENQVQIVQSLDGYKIVDMAKTIEVVKKVWNDQNLSKFARYVASSFLTENAVSGYPSPKITDEEWQQNINIMDEVRYYGNKSY